ncbi:peroxiredoxin [bacterium]|nr:peroxiredoxin [bacterium]
MKPVSVGSTIPLFELPDQHGATVRIDSLLGRKMLVIYFYPKDDSPGCTKQACYFQDMYEVFREAGAEVIGISGQSVESHRAFAEKYHLSFILLSDAGNRVRRRFGVPADLLGLLPGRVTYVVDRNGTIVYMFDSQTQAERHVDEALRVIREKTGAAATEGGNS